jgi:hypothetical protein
MQGEIEITVGDVNDVEALVLARYIGPDEKSPDAAAPIMLHGTLRGPHCETARTLPAVFMFRPVQSASQPEAEAIVSDPCVWSSELPHLYQCDVVAKCGDDIVAEYHGAIGLRRRA